ncbi:hypothetical protein C7974DRAFT_376800 [Boeremia exigua]|uniref:uncharacterized protein n=1 Tax=Boeremia exigua TaxID=749465 RepID=UPI001E8CDD97|nr:uncharacterized protein C7974DRAFT_376800 [Boeremia exigua]KAH6625259.1 hypothetical protein C7974DRAFT_376800 [Boeremia exigua]
MGPPHLHRPAASPLKVVGMSFGLARILGGVTQGCRGFREVWCGDDWSRGMSKCARCGKQTIADDVHGRFDKKDWCHLNAAYLLSAPSFKDLRSECCLASPLHGYGVIKKVSGRREATPSFQDDPAIPRASRFGNLKMHT